jgi:hypothetical protein
MIDMILILLATVVVVSALGMATNGLDWLMAWWERNR